MKIKEIKGMPDYREIIDLINAEWQSEFGEKTDEERIQLTIKSHNRETDTVKYLYDGDKVIGFYRYSLWPREDKNTKTAHTFDIAILPSYQRKGLGTLLMKDMFRDCRLKGITKLLSRSFRNNTGSLKLHESLGFKKHLETDDSIVWEIELK